MVTGGESATYDMFASTEIYRNNVWSVLPSAVLPSPTNSLSAGKIDDTIFLIGKEYGTPLAWLENPEEKTIQPPFL